MYLSVSLLLALLLGGCSGQPEASAAPTATETAVEVAVERASGVTVPNVLELDGTLRAKRSARISPLVAGHVKRVLVERGDVVRQGQTLIELVSTDLALDARAASARATAQREQLGLEAGQTDQVDAEENPQVIAAKADWDAIRDQLERNQQLHSMGAISDQVFEQSRSAEAAARARYQSARQGVHASVASYSALSAEAARRRDDASNTRVKAPF
ncbi:MAG: biotin/lipoyl-binding protein, partial [Polyangiaceae bacterium]|nr:biotin/lipoyl-binding protein [Polyangiaceae bacterium]